MEWNFQETLIMLLIVALFFKEVGMAWLKKMFGINGDGKSADTPHWASELKEHYNDTTTALLQKLVDKSDGQCKKLDAIIGGQKEGKEDDKEWRGEVRDMFRELIKK